MIRRIPGLLVLAAAVLLLVAPSIAPAHERRGSVAAAEVSEPCPPDSYYPNAEPIEPDRVITGEFAAEREGSFVFLPFRVPQGQTALRVRYCFDQPELVPESAPGGHTLDLGLYEPRADRSGPWGVREFRGWGGSSHRDVTLSPQGYSSEMEYRDQEWVPGRTTRAFEPGPIRQGRWAVELGLASIASRDQGDADGRVAYRVEIDWQDDPSFAADPYEPAPYDRRPAVDRPGWYAGDFHVHGEHSALGDAAMSEVFDYAFGSLEEGKAGLDFITLSDYVSGASWDEVGRYQEDYPDNLIIRSAEVITYRGHASSHANTGVVDYRTGPLYVRRPDGLDRLRDARPASAILDRIHRAGGFTQINHP
ncbi:MAG TPA: hypothetical protein VGR10_01245, partial [Thermoleophilaceae bacterium]|nr:hypothetical protein [Thermoleophilaceae bacterium]